MNISIKLLAISFFLAKFTIAQSPSAVNIRQAGMSSNQINNKSTSQNEDSGPDFFIMMDSILGNWGEFGKGIQLKSDEYMVTTITGDSGGNLYAIGSIHENNIYGEHLFRFSDQNWQLFERNLTGQILTLLNDGNGVVYAVTNTKIYKADDNQWQEMATGEFSQYNVFIGFDGNIYTTEKIYKKKVYQFTQVNKIKNHKAELLLDNGKPLRVLNRELFVDRMGFLYQCNGKENRIEIWDGSKWNFTESISLMPDNFWGFDSENTLYISSHSVGEKKFVKRLDGLTWTELDLPDSLRVKVQDWRLVTSTKGEIFLKTDIRFQETTLYHIKKDKFELVAQQPKPKLVGQIIRTFVIAGEHFIALQEDRDYLAGVWFTVVKPVQYTPGWNIKVRKMAKVPDSDIISSHYLDDYKNIFRCYLFEENGRYGLQTIHGRIIAEPVFNDIHVVYTPLKITELKNGEELSTNSTLFCYKLIDGRDTLYAKIGSYDFELPDPGTLETFKCRTNSVCQHCNGAGRIQAHTETIKERGEWIPDEIISTSTYTDYDKHFDPGSGKTMIYVTTRTSSSVIKGHYGPNVERTIQVPESECKWCKGRPIKRSYLIYKFDKNTNAYSLAWL